MKDNWPRAGGLLLVSEGDELNINPPGTPAGQGEPGGASHYGVSVAALTDLRRSQGLGPATVAMVAALTASQALDFYHAVTARACRFDDLAAGVDYAMLDVTANLGPAGGPWLLQCVLGIWPHTNTITDYVVERANAMDPHIVVYAIGAAWLAKKREALGWPKSGHGWTNRMVRVRGDALNMIGEVK